MEKSEKEKDENQNQGSVDEKLEPKPEPEEAAELVLFQVSECYVYLVHLLI